MSDLVYTEDRNTCIVHFNVSAVMFFTDNFFFSKHYRVPKRESGGYTSTHTERPPKTERQTVIRNEENYTKLQSGQCALVLAFAF